MLRNARFLAGRDLAHLAKSARAKPLSLAAGHRADCSVSCSQRRPLVPDLLESACESWRGVRGAQCLGTRAESLRRAPKSRRVGSKGRRDEAFLRLVEWRLAEPSRVRARIRVLCSNRRTRSIAAHAATLSSDLTLACCSIFRTRSRRPVWLIH